jgi:hypothetical protein
MADPQIEVVITFRYTPVLEHYKTDAQPNPTIADAAALDQSNYDNGITTVLDLVETAEAQTDGEPFKVEHHPLWDKDEVLRILSDQKPGVGYELTQTDAEDAYNDFDQNCDLSYAQVVDLPRIDGDDPLEEAIAEHIYSHHC